ncbi:carbohydrate ABC transporter permease [Clostridium sp. E02]|uniref:carbohydrate ABC transporter permease n=1 Tax=Clostridium sp. E02 TaxID=2487134 RepID=UPI000F542675|nr:carbohydrate ABC transporter permease [Clostridium sp. E02]
MKNMSDEIKFNRLGTVFLTILAIIALMPIIMIVIASFSDEKALLANGYSYFPKAWSLDAYYYMFNQGKTIVRAYGISLFVTITGTVGSVLVTAMLAYPMSRKNFKYKNVLSFFVFLTMLFNGGIVASYMMWSNIFHIKNTVWALIFPNYFVTAFNVFLVRNFYSNNIPEALIESAQIDGATELRIFWRIILPLSVPTVATISLFTGLCYWNDWVNGLYYIRDAKFFGIQNLLIKIMNNIEFLKSGSSNLLGTGNMNLPGSSVRMAMAVIGILPILFIYPFVQKYFIKGVVIGAVKG